MAYISKEDVYRVSGLPSDGSVISDNDIDMHIEEAESYVERLAGTCFQVGGRAVTETYDGDDTDTMFLDHYPLITLSSLSIDSTAVTTTKVWTWAATGKVKLKTTAEVTKFTGTDPQLVSVTYTYGEEPDDRIKRFTASIAASASLIQQVGGTFDDVTSFQLPQMSGSLGEPWTQIRETLQRLRDEQRTMLEQGVIRIKPQFG